MKIIEKSMLSKSEQDKLINEVEILSELDHPYIMKIIEFCDEKNSFYIITELFEGKELFEKIIEQENNTFSEKDAAKIFK